jgi:hypothetical protein
MMIRMNTCKSLNFQHNKNQTEKKFILATKLARITVFLLIGTTIFWFGCGKDDTSNKSKPAADSDRQATTSTNVKPDFQKLAGRWVRPDGGYVIEIRNVDAHGKAEAAYFNPRPINVSRAEISDDGTVLKLFVELWDDNYPGSNYNLTYDPEQDILYGIYYQAQMGQNFEVMFTRQK